MCALAVTAIAACTNSGQIEIPKDTYEECVWFGSKTEFALWAPTADEVELRLYEDGLEGEPFQTLPMKKCREGDRADGEEANRSVIVEHGLVHISFGVKDVLALVGVDEMEVVLREGRGKEILQEDIARLLRSLLERVLNDNVSAHILVQA